MKKKLLIQHFYILITCDFVYSLAMKISNNINSEKVILNLTSKVKIHDLEIKIHFW